MVIFFINTIFITKECIMKRTIKLTERNLTHIIRKIISEQVVDQKADLIQVLTDKLESMKSNTQFTADDVCETIINNCNPNTPICLYAE